ncbi:MAG: response regulator transcription factor [Verrucomicrobiota bacterium]
MKKKINILIVDDHFVVRIGLLTSLKMNRDIESVFEASTGRQAIELYRKHQPNVVLMDLRLPDMTGIEATVTLCRDFPGAKVIIISSFDAQEDVYRAFQAGALGYLRKDVLGEELFRAIKTVAAGGKFVPPEIARSLAEHASGSELTPRELEVLHLLIKGLSNKEIGGVLGASEFTAKFHVKNILAKLEVSDRTEAATAAFQRGIIH